MPRSMLDETDESVHYNGTSCTETSPLLPNQASTVPSSWRQEVPSSIEPHERPVLSPRCFKTTWRQEATTIAAWSVPLLMTQVFQRGINFVSIFIVGRLGTRELGAVSLASITTNMIGNTIIQGLANSLDTLAGQAFGSGNKHLVGIHTQRMVYFILLCTAPLMALWWKAGDVLAPILPDRELAELTGLYLRIMILRVPAFVLFECGKRYAQAQGIFNAATYVLLLVAPFNACLMWALVWHLGWGFIGGPIAIVFTENLMALLLFLYLWLIDGYQCWGGFSKKALSNWKPMMRLAIPGMVMHVAEFAADEILTIACAQFGAAQLAAQSALVTLTQITWTVPLAISIAASIRVANLIGAKATDAATMAAVVAVVLGLIVTTLCIVLTAALRYHIPYWFTDDMEVVSIITKALPIVMVMQFFDATSAISHGLMRGIGYQEFGGYLNLAAYNLIAIPISFSTAFLLHWQIYGLWTGIAVGLGIVSVVEFWWLYRWDWEEAVADAEGRNEGIESAGCTSADM